MPNVEKFAERHPFLATLLVFVFVSLPDSIQKIWSLFSERPLGVVLRENGGAIVPTLSLYWITIPLGIGMFVAIFYVVKRKHSITFSYAYGLAFKGFHLGYEEGGEKAVEASSFQIGLNFVNVTDGPLKYYVDQVDVVVGDRTHNNPHFETRGSVLSRGMGTTFFYPPFSRTVVAGSSADITVRYTVRYGHPDLDFSRRATKEIKTGIIFGAGATLRPYVLSSEADDAI